MKILLWRLNLSIVEGETSSLSIGAYTHIMLCFLVIVMKKDVQNYVSSVIFHKTDLI